MTHLEYRKLEDLPTKAVADFILPWSMPGAEMKIRHFRYGIPGSRPRVYLQASLHADEIPGMLVLHHLMRLLDTADRARHIRGEIIIVPAANPMGLSQWTFGTQQGRFESKSGINFNRDYPFVSEALVETVKNQLNDEASENRELIRQSALTELGNIQPKTTAEAMKQHLLGKSLPGFQTRGSRDDLRRKPDRRLRCPCCPQKDQYTADDGTCHQTRGSHPRKIAFPQ